MLPYQRLVRQLIKRNYKLLGSGCYSAVFETRCNSRAIKIGSTLSDPWIVYADSIKDSDNLHFPRIYSLYQNECEDYYVAVVERLSPVEDFGADLKTFRDAVLNNRPRELEQREALKVLNRLLSRMDYAKLDLHLENIMMRGDTFVISDPLAEREIDSGFEAWIEETLSEEYYY